MSQIVEDWWYKADGQWTVKSDPFIDDWSEVDYISLAQFLRNTISMGGVVLGAKKLYISAHSAVETQAFYKAMGCVEALEYNKLYVEKEPYDCQLEYTLI